jgi:hypothetical protein
LPDDLYALKSCANGDASHLDGDYGADEALFRGWNAASAMRSERGCAGWVLGGSRSGREGWTESFGITS